MKLKIVATLFLLFLLFPKSTVLAYDCSYGDSNGTNGWNENARSLMVCFGGAATPQDLNGISISVKCLNNSNMIPGGLCRGVEGGTTVTGGYNSKSSWNTQPAAGQNPDGTWFGCNTFTGVNRAIGELKVNFSFPDGTSCSTPQIVTQPKNWNAATEGMPWQTGTNNPNGNNVLCVDGVSVNTALGCINIGSGNELVNTIIRLALGMSGGLALALILYGVFIITTSAGMPDKLKAGSEIITSAIIGLIFIILSVFLVNLIGINILGIPGLS